MAGDNAETHAAPGSASSVAHELEAEVARVKDAEATASERLKLIRLKRRFLERLRDLQHSDPPGAVWLFLRDSERTLRRIREGGGSIPPFLEMLRGELRELLEAELAQWPKRFVAELSVHDIEPDRGSRHPRYSFAEGLITVELDDRNLVAKLTTRHGASTTVPLDARTISSQVAEQQQRLAARPFDAGSFLRALYDAYEEIRVENKAAPGEDQRLPEVLKRLQRSQDAQLDELLVDLGRLLRGDTPQIEGRRLRIGHTRRDKDGVLVPGLEDGGYLGFIAFPTGGG